MKRIVSMFALAVCGVATLWGSAWGQFPYPSSPAMYAPPPGPYGPGGYGPPPPAAAPMGYPPPGFDPAGMAPPGMAHPGAYAPPPYAPSPYAPSPYAPSPYAPSPYAPSPYAPSPYAPAMYQPAPQPFPTMEPMAPDYYQSGDVGSLYGGDYCPMCPHCGANGGACHCGLGGAAGASVFGSLELLLWYRHGGQLPPLVTTALPGTARVDAGVLGEPTTRLLHGDDRYDDGMKGGVRFTLGAWLDERREAAVVWRIVGLDTASARFDAVSDGSVTLARPFFDATLNAQNAQLVAFTDPNFGPLASGEIHVNNSNDVFDNQLYTLLLVSRGYGWRVDMLAGYHYSKIEDRLTVQSVSTSQSALFLAPVGSTLDVLDVFNVENNFHGGMLGLQSEVQYGRVQMRFLGKLSVGGTRQRMAISGRTITTAPTDPPTVAVANGGLLALPTNIGVYQRDVTTLVPEAGITLAWQATEDLTFTMGYSFMYWTNIAQAGPQVDTTVNLTQVGGGALVGPARPSHLFTDSDFWAMGLNLGVEYRY